MILIITIIISIIIIQAILYTLLILKFHVLNAPNLELKQLKANRLKTEVLVIYPHPDDETMMSGGLIQQLVKDQGFNVHVVTTTKGDKGDEILKLPPKELGEVRKKEFEKTMESLGVKNFYAWDFPDGELEANYDKLKEATLKFINDNNIKVVITYERFGVYGHPDHVALSKAINEIHANNSDLKILYGTISPKIAKYLNLKSHMKGLNLADFESNEAPEFKVPVFFEMLTQYRAAKNYKSQNLSHKQPLWVTILMTPFEYYTTRYA
jgi:LmbE family N-acetylglucosaminyl deacetylase